MIIKSKKLQTITQNPTKQLQTVNMYGVTFTVTYHPEHDDYILRRHDGEIHERNFSEYSIEDEMRDCNPLTKWQLADRPQPTPAPEFDIWEGTTPKPLPRVSDREFDALWFGEQSDDNPTAIPMQILAIADAYLEAVDPCELDE